MRLSGQAISAELHVAEREPAGAAVVRFGLFGEVHPAQATGGQQRRLPVPRLSVKVIQRVLE